MKKYITVLIFLISSLNLGAMDEAPAKSRDVNSIVSSLIWATATNSRTLEFMAHTGLKKLVPRDVLMKKYGLPIVAGSSLFMGSFDERNADGLSGNLISTCGSIINLNTLLGLCGNAFLRREAIERLSSNLQNLENEQELKDYMLIIAEKLLRNLRKLENENARKEFPRISSLLPHYADYPLAGGVSWNADKFFENENERPTFPIAFATDKAFSEMYQAKNSGCPFEFISTKEMELGATKDIQYVIIPQDYSAFINNLLDEMFSDPNEKPIILTFEEIHGVVMHRLFVMQTKIPTMWPKYFNNEMPALLENDLEKNFEFLPAFISKLNPSVLTCRLDQLGTVTKILEENNLRPAHLRSPALLSMTALHVPSSLLAAEAHFLIEQWSAEIKLRTANQFYDNGRPIIGDKIPIDVEIAD